nr:LCP family protein [Chloroflexota bacterium]
DGRPSGLSLPAGPVQLDGEMALAYVRTRKGAGDSDFTRAARQQQILLALRQKLTDPGMLPRLPELVSAAAEIIRTSYPASEIGQAFQIAQSMDAASDRVVLGPPYSHHPPSSSTGGSWTLKLDLDRVAVLSRELFGADSRYAGS